MEKSVNNKCKAFTSLEQSRKLAEFLPIESADMCLNISQLTNMKPLMTPYCKFKEFFNMEETPDFLIPCWSLASLLELLPKRYNDNTVYIPLVGKYYEGDKFICGYFGDGLLDWTFGETPVDACYKMIVKLNELKLL